MAILRNWLAGTPALAWGRWRSIAGAGPATVALGCALGACTLDNREIDVVDTGLLPPDAGSQPGVASCTGDGCGGECSPNDRRCDATTGLPQRCSVAGAWQDEAPCPFACSGAGSCGGECVPAMRRCDPVTGEPQLCDGAGAWQQQPSCPFVCTGDGVCTGECLPDTSRCHPQTGVPQLCDAGGSYRDQSACRTGEVCSAAGDSAGCTCQEGLDACSGGCFDLDSDSNHCGACGRGCQGQPCSAGRCEPATLVSGQAVTYRMALSDRELFFINAGGDLNRVSKQGGPSQAIAVATELRGVGADGGALFWAQLPGPALDTFQIWRLGASGTAEAFAESPASDVGMGIGVISIRSLYLGVGTDALRVQDGFVYWSRDGYRRAPTTATPLAAGELLGVEVMHGMLGPAGACIYSADFTALYRSCTGGREALVHSGSAILDVVTDADGVFFSEVGLGLRHLSLGSDTPTITTLAPSSYALLGLATDASSVYFIDPAADPSTAGICIPGQGSIRRVSKDGGEPAPLVEGIPGCPRFIAADDTFVYWAAWEGTSPTSGYVAKVAK